MSLSVIPLQFIARASDSAAIIMGVLFVVLTLMVIVSAKRGGGNRKTKDVRKGNLKKLAKQYNLDKQHVQLLQQAIRAQHIINVYQFFHNMGYLNRATQKIIERVEHSNLAQKNKVQAISLAFELRRRIEDKFARMKNSQKKRADLYAQAGSGNYRICSKSPPWPFASSGKLRGSPAN